MAHALRIIAEHSNKQFKRQEYSISVIPPDFGLLKSLVTFHFFLGLQFFQGNWPTSIIKEPSSLLPFKVSEKPHKLRHQQEHGGRDKGDKQECTVLEAEVTAGMGRRQCCCNWHHLYHLNLKWVSRDSYRAALRWFSKSQTLWIGLEFGIRK